MAIISKNKKNDFPVKLFVAGALLNLVLVLGIIIIWRLSVIEANMNINSPRSGGSGLAAPENQKDDPLITRIPKFSDYLTQPLVNSADPSIGNEKAPMVIVLFGDYQCEACKTNSEIIKKAVGLFPNRVRFIWKDFPAADLNSLSWQAATAARCAGSQSKYWEYGGLLFDNLKNLDENSFENLAKSLGLGMDKFKECYYGHKMNKAVVDNLTEAETLELSGSPTVYINGDRITGELKEQELIDMVKNSKP
ncbi:MAG: thioredoxin domain-containing protein [Patescibacteria group bacterium]|jgi:predicted DsbA family dithiol-disulfide isomerase